MPTGTVKWFSNLKGYGFVNTDDDQEQDIFAHFSYNFQELERKPVGSCLLQRVDSSM